MKNILIITFLCLICISTKAQSSIIPVDYQSICDYDNFLKTKNKDDIYAQAKKEHYLELLGIVLELAQYRQAFIQNGNFVNLFPTAYFHTTAMEMTHIVANDRYDYPVEKMKQMIAFYEAYKYNRMLFDVGQINNIEAHWKQHFVKSNKDLQYFEKIMEIDDMGGVAQIVYQFTSTLCSSIDAHVITDLPRAIKFAYDNRQNRNILSDKLYNDFSKTDDIFDNTQLKTIEDFGRLS